MALKMKGGSGLEKASEGGFCRALSTTVTVLIIVVLSAVPTGESQVPSTLSEAALSECGTGEILLPPLSWSTEPAMEQVLCR